MAILSYAQKQRIARRNSDITRLQSEFQKSVNDYNTAVDNKTATFNSQKAEYDNLYAGYSDRLSAYKGRLDDYNTKMRAYIDAPNETYNNYQYIPRLNAYGSMNTHLVNGNLYVPNAPDPRIVGSMVNDPNLRGMSGPYAFTLKPGYSYSSGQIYGKSVVYPGEFTEKFDEQAPTAPTMDTSAESAKLQADKAYTEREVDERVKSRARAVQRANTRPMLSQGVKLNG